MIETAELQARKAAREEAENAYEFAEKLRRHFSDAEPSSCAEWLWMLERAEQEEYDAFARLIKLADERDNQRSHARVKGILTSLALGAVSWALIIACALAARKWA